jgi:hypothetical protein
MRGNSHIIALAKTIPTATNQPHTNHSIPIHISSPFSSCCSGEKEKTGYVNQAKEAKKGLSIAHRLPIAGLPSANHSLIV